jgi:hypothetical protein
MLEPKKQDRCKQQQSLEQQSGQAKQSKPKTN